MNDSIASALLSVFPQIVPEGLLLLGACVLFIGATFRADRNLWGGVALLTLVGAGIALAFSPLAHARPQPEVEAVVYAAPLYMDRVALLVRIIALAGGFILVLCSWNEVPDRQAAEYHGCLLVLIAGLGLTGGANDLVTLFLALEMISIPTYILLYLPRLDTPAQEAAMKYFLLSVFSSALLLFGFSYLYGLGGTTNLPALADALRRAPQMDLPGVALVALVMVVAGLGFRITAVPFHFYAPDVYQGTVSSVAALLAFVPKVAGFVALLRVFGYIPHEMLNDKGVVVLLEEALREGDKFSPNLVLGVQVPHLLWIVAVVTMSLGNLLALLQDNIRRLLAYSSVAHAGYMLIGLVVARFQPSGQYWGSVDAVLFYLIAYGAMTIGAFAVLGYLSTRQQPVETVDDLGGLGQSRPGVALLMTLFLFSLIGIPLTAGFAGKVLLFWGALAVPTDPMDPVWFRVLAFIAAINAAIGAWYYLRIIGVMFLRNPLRRLPLAGGWPSLAAVALCALVTLVAGSVGVKPVVDGIHYALPHPQQVEAAEPATSTAPGAGAALVEK